MRPCFSTAADGDGQDEVSGAFIVVMKEHGVHPTGGCPLYSQAVAEFAELEHLRLPRKQTILLIAADVAKVSRETIVRVAAHLIGSGIIYLCAWGPGCERVHDVFDEVLVGDGLKEPGRVMTTWHSRECLEEALWFWIQCTLPFQEAGDAESYVAVTVGNQEWAATVEEALADVSAFTERGLDSSG